MNKAETAPIRIQKTGACRFSQDYKKWEEKIGGENEQIL